MKYFGRVGLALGTVKDKGGKLGECEKLTPKEPYGQI